MRTVKNTVRNPQTSFLQVQAVGLFALQAFVAAMHCFALVIWTLPVLCHWDAEFRVESFHVQANVSRYAVAAVHHPLLCHSYRNSLLRSAFDAGSGATKQVT